MPARHAGAKLNYDCMALINAGSTGRRRAMLAGRHFPARSARVVRLRHRASPLRLKLGLGGAIYAGDEKCMGIARVPIK